MKARFFILLILTCLLLPQWATAQTPTTVILGDTSFVSYDYPFCNYYRGSWNESLYTPSEIGQSGYISEIAYHCAYADTLTFADLRIYLGVTRDTTLDEADFLPMSELTLVYSATNVLMGTHTGWYPFVLQTPYYYDAEAGESLVVVVAKYSYDYNSQLEWYGDYSEDLHTQTLFYECDDEDRSCSQHPTMETEPSRRAERAQMRLTLVPMVEGLCEAPTAIDIVQVTAHSASIQWTSAEGATEWELVCGPAGFHPDSTGADIQHVAPIATNNYMLTNLTADYAYNVYVRTVCSDANKSNWRSIDVRTLCDAVASFPYEENFDDVDGMLPSCWDKVVGRSHYYPRVSIWYARTGSSLEFYGDGTDSVQVVELPPMERLDTLELSFFALRTDEGTRLEVGVMEGENFVLVEDVTAEIGYEEYPLQSLEVDFSNYQGTGNRIALRAVFDDLYSEVAIDDLSIGGNGSQSSRRAFEVSVTEENGDMGYVYAYTENPYHYVENGYTVQIDSGATLYIRAYCYGEESMIASATLNGEPFLTCPIRIDTTIEVVVTENLEIRVAFVASMPDLHVVALSHSPMRAGENATISWTVRNDGQAATPNGVTWYDRLWISMECRVATEDDNPTFLGEFPNIRVLNPGESYTQTQTVMIPNGVDGDKYLFAITDAHDCYSIQWEEGNVAPIPCPAATGHYVTANSAHCTGEHCQDYAGSNVNEYLDEYIASAMHDNFYYDTVHIQTGHNPDLQVVNMVHPTNLYSGSFVEVFANVVNAGERQSSFRQDALYISNSPVFDSNAVFLSLSYQSNIPVPNWNPDGSVAGFTMMRSYGMSTLRPGETRIDSFDCVLPEDIYGTAYFYVALDVDNDNYEHAGEDNNIVRSEAVNILLSPYPDLMPTEITAQREISTGDTFAIEYSVVNQGVGNAGGRWTDRLFLSTHSEGIGNDAIEIETIPIVSYEMFDALEPEDHYSRLRKVILPEILDSGMYYLYVSVDDERDVFEYLYESNNVVRMPDMIHVIQPDLTVAQVMAEDTLLLGANNRIAYILENQGEGDVNNLRRTDRIIISRTADGNDERYYCHNNKRLLLQTGRTLTEEFELRPERSLPEGQYYLFVLTNEESDINESDHQNNLSTGVPIYLKRALLPDLQVANIQHYTSLQGGNNASIGFDITNNATADLHNGSLDFNIYATNGTDTNYCPIIDHTQAFDDINIPMNGSQHFDCNILVSPTVDATYNELLVEVDARNTIRELDDSNNISGAMVTYIPYPFDLVLQSVTADNNATTGDSITLSWTVRNQGSIPNNYTPLYINHYGSIVDASQYRDEEDSTHSTTHLWKDGIYLSYDTEWDTNDLLLADLYNYHFLTPNSTYSESVRFPLPYRNWGDLYLLTKADCEKNTFDNNRTNNTTATPIHIDLGLTPDLRITEMSFHRNNVERSQSYTLYYTVQNQGYGTTPQEEWIDNFYLNSTGSFSSDYLVGYKHHHGALMGGESYSDSVTVSIPHYDQGNYIFGGFVDATDQVFEYGGEENNRDTMSLYITLPLPSDLIPGQPAFTDTVLLKGQKFAISYNLRNQGANTAYGQVKELVYLSTDNQWSSDDLLISSRIETIAISAGDEQTLNAYSDGAGINPGNYYVIVRSNAYNALNESSYTNNTVVSMRRIHIDYPSLYIEQPYNEDHVSKANRYFRFEVTGDLVGQTLLCQVSGIDLQGLYLSYLNTPTPVHFDYYTNNRVTPNTTDYELVVPALSVGTYYLLLQMGNVSSNYNNLQINTSIVNFDILSVDAARGANSGSLTTRIRGAKFDTIMDFRLERNGQYIPASKVHIKNSSDAYTTFDLTDMDPGQYDVVAELEGGVIASKSQAFTIEEGLPANLNARIEGPSTVRVGIVFQASVEYSNTGMTDVPVAGLMVVSRNGHPIAFTTNGLNEGVTQLFVPVSETDGNPNVIRPGHSGTKNIFVYPNNAEEVVLDLYTVKSVQ